MHTKTHTHTSPAPPNRSFLKQQAGYGDAEAKVEYRQPARFTPGKPWCAHPCALLPPAFASPWQLKRRLHAAWSAFLGRCLPTARPAARLPGPADGYMLWGGSVYGQGGSVCGKSSVFYGVSYVRVPGCQQAPTAAGSLFMGSGSKQGQGSSCSARPGEREKEALSFPGCLQSLQVRRL